MAMAHSPQSQLKHHLCRLDSDSHTITCSTPSSSNPNLDPTATLARDKPLQEQGQEHDHDHDQDLDHHTLSHPRSHSHSHSHNQISFPSSPRDSHSTDELANDADDEDESVSASDSDHPHSAHFTRSRRSHISSQSPPHLSTFSFLPPSSSISTRIPSPALRPPRNLPPPMPRRKLVKPRSRKPLPPDTSSHSYTNLTSDPRPSSSASITTLVRVSQIPIPRPCSVPLDDPCLSSLKQAWAPARASRHSSNKPFGLSSSLNALPSKRPSPQRSLTLPPISTTRPLTNHHRPLCINSSSHSSPTKIPADCRLSESWDSNQILAELNLGPTRQTPRPTSSEESDSLDLFATPSLETSHQQSPAKQGDAFDQETQNDSESSLDPDEFLSKVAGNVARIACDAHASNQHLAACNFHRATPLQYTHSSPLNTTQTPSRKHAGLLQANRRSQSIGAFQLGHKALSASVHNFVPMQLHPAPPCRRSLDQVNSPQSFRPVQRLYEDHAQPKNHGSATKARTSPRAIDEFDSKLALLQQAIDSGNIDSLDVPSLIKWEDDSSGENDDGLQSSGHLPRRTSDVNLTSSIVYSSHPFSSPKACLGKSSTSLKPPLSLTMPSSIPRSSSFESIRSPGGEFPISERTIIKTLNKPLLSESLTLEDEDSNGEFEELHDLQDLTPDLDIDQREESSSHYNSSNHQNPLVGSDGCVASASYISSGTGPRTTSEDDFPRRVSFDQRLTDHRQTLINMQRPSQESLTGSSDLKRLCSSQGRTQFAHQHQPPHNPSVESTAGLVYLPYAPTSPVPSLRQHPSRTAMKPHRHARSSSFISVTLKKLSRKLQPKHGSDCPSLEQLNSSQDHHLPPPSTHLSLSSHPKPIGGPTHVAMQQSVSYDSKLGPKSVSHLRGMSVGAVAGWSGLSRLPANPDGSTFSGNLHSTPLACSIPQRDRLSFGVSPAAALPQTPSVTTDHLPEPVPEVTSTRVVSTKPAEVLRLNDILRQHQQDEKDYMKNLARVVLERKVLSEQSPSTV